MPVVEREETRAQTELGAAQKDTAREFGAKLSSLKGIVWVGVGLFVFGLASLFWPPLKAVIGSVTTSAAVMAGGLCLMVLPSLIVGNELLILGGVSVAVGGWFLAHRHGQLSGIVAASNAGQTKAPPPAQPQRPPPPLSARRPIPNHVSRFTFHASRIMNSTLNSQLPAPHSLSSEGTAVGLFAAALLLARKLFAPKPAKPEFDEPVRVLRRDACPQG